MRSSQTTADKFLSTRSLAVIGLSITGVAGCGGVQPNPPAIRYGLSQPAYVPLFTFQTSVGPATLRRNNATGTYDIRYLTAPYAPVPLPLGGNVQMVNQSAVGAEQVIAFKGSNPRCPNEYLFFSTTRAHYTMSPFGDCRSDYTFLRSKDGNSLAAVQIGAADPEYWVYSKAAVHGPTLRSALNANPKKPDIAAVPSPAYRGGRALPQVQQPPQAPPETPRSTAPLQHASPDLLPTPVEVPNTLVKSSPTVVLDDPQPKSE